MKAILLLCCSGLVVAVAILFITRSQERARTAIELATLKQALARSEENLQRERKAALAEQHLVKNASERPQPQQATVMPPSTPPSVSPANAAILGYLGDPIVAPQNLDPKYSPEELAAVFKSACDAAGIKVEQVAVDTSEFPFIVHGTVEKGTEDAFFGRIDAALRAVPGYTAGGSSTGRTNDSSPYFAMNITPSSAFPHESSETIRRRLMLRLQMIAAAWSDPGR